MVAGVVFRSRALALAVALALVAVAAPAHANDKRAASAAFQKGRGYYDAGQFSDALIAFKDGYNAYPLPGFLVNIGQCQRKLDRLDDAQSAFEQFLASDSTDERTRAEVRDAIDEINGERSRRAEAARREADEARAREALTRAPAIAPAPVAATPAFAPVATLDTQMHDKAEPKKKSKKWVWGIVVPLVVGAAAGAVTVGILETRPVQPRPGSLGVLDGTR